MWRVQSPSPLTPALERAHAFVASGDLPSAVALLERAVVLGRENLGEDSPAVLATQRELAVVQRQAGDPAAARRVLETAYAAGQWRLGDGDPLMLQISYDLGTVAAALGNRHEARKAFARLAAHGPAALGEGHWAVARARAYLAQDQATTDVRGEAPPPPAPPIVPVPAAAPPATPGPVPLPAPGVPSASPSVSPGAPSASPPEPAAAPAVEPGPALVPPTTPADFRDLSQPWRTRPSPGVPVPASDPPPENSEPGTARGLARLAEPEPAEPEPAEPEQADLKPARSGPNDSRPARSGLADSEPVESEPAEPGPTDWEPVKSEPAEPEPVESGRGESEAGEPRPADTGAPPPKRELTFADLIDPIDVTVTKKPAESATAAAEERPAGPWTAPPARVVDSGKATWESAPSSPTGQPYPGPAAMETRRPYPWESPTTDQPAANPPSAPPQWPDGETPEPAAESPGSASQRPGGGIPETAPHPPEAGPVWQPPVARVSEQAPVPWSREATGAFPAVSDEYFAEPPVDDSGPGKSGRLAVLLVVLGTVAALAAVAALVVVLVRRDAGPAVAGPPPTGLSIVDQGAEVAMTWTAPAGDEPQVVLAARQGEPLRTVAPVGAGETGYLVRGLDETVDHCFAVAAVYDEDRYATSDQVCTRRR